MEIKIVFSEYPDLEKLRKLDDYLGAEFHVCRWGKETERMVHFYISHIDNKTTICGSFVGVKE